MQRVALLIFVLSTTLAAPASADVVVLDDSIIDGSQCVGLDCVNGEVFDFNTFVLKENNLRILFQDTSSSSSFPTHDWLLVANDSSNGGADRFSIHNETMGTIPFTVAGANGNVGIGTATPTRTLHISTGDTPTIRLDQTGDVGWTPYVWDIGGNESNLLIKDDSGTVVVQVMPGGDMTIAGTLTQSSSRDFKHGIVSVQPENILDRVNDLDISRWRYIQDADSSEHIGPMAEDFHRAFGLGADNKHIAASDMAGVAVASIQALNQMVERQAQQLAQISGENAVLKRRLDRLEARLSK